MPTNATGHGDLTAARRITAVCQSLECIAHQKEALPSTRTAGIDRCRGPQMPVLTFAHRLSESALDRVQRALLTVLRAGPIPQHVAFVMDGNRRYARNKGMKVIQGHVDGFVALRRVRLSHFHPRTATT